eukprot:CAMPEP_0184484736 /NCGR_PEP_ID=MMETSP0113_2-20130426/6410_1 /TAXON_ID=91329 /ORGANISM="Norrisiella sphaerica, Strain BC52" /LENGTH=609 /DNA_ID=CAMNT_0026865845 /DNA_START=35 /DNA_END=1864 /DNA_ORIENTATION=+
MSTAGQKPQKIGGGAKTMYSEFEWSDVQLGFALGVFYLGYLLLQLPVKCFLRYISAKNIFLLGILGATVMTVITPACAPNFWLLLMVRFCTGLFEGVTYPSMAHMVVVWVPFNERSKALAVTSSGAYLGTAVSLPTSGLLVSYCGWRSVFYAYGFLGLFWVFLWHVFGPDTPESCSHIHPIEAAYILIHRGDGRKTEELNSNSNSNSNSKSGCRRDGQRKRMEPEHPDIAPYPHIDDDDDNASFFAGTTSFTSPHQLDVKVRDAEESAQFGERDSLIRHSADEEKEKSKPRGNNFESLEADSGPRTVSVGRYREGNRNVSRQLRPVVSEEREGDGVREETEAREETFLPEGMTWLEFLNHSATRAGVVGAWSYCWVFFTMLSEYPSFASSRLNMSVETAGASAIAGYVTLWFTTSITGYLSDVIINTGWISRLGVRRLTYAGGMVPSSILLGATGYVTNPVAAITLITLAIGIAGIAFSGVWAHVLDVSGDHPSLLYATANVAATVPGFLSPVLVGVYLEKFGEADGWRMTFWTACGVGILGSIVFSLWANSTKLGSELGTESDSASETPGMLRLAADGEVVEIVGGHLKDLSEDGTASELSDNLREQQ